MGTQDGTMVDAGRALRGAHLLGTLTAEDVAMLRRPYAPEAVKWLPIGKPRSDGKMQFMPHIDASLVFERLSEVDPCWTEETVPLLSQMGLATAQDPFGAAHGLPWSCRMTVKGVTKSNVGQLDANTKPDNKHLKSGHSDAIKRAAWAFGVGAYLRAIPAMLLPPVDANGKKLFWTKTKNNELKLGGLNPEGTNVLRQMYRQIVEHEKFVEHYGAPVLYGDVADIVVEEPAPEDDVTDGTSDAELHALLAITRHNGRDTPEDVIRETLGKVTFPKALAQALNTVKSTLMLSAEDAEKVRLLAVGAGEGDEAMLAELVEALEVSAAQVDADAGEQGAMPV